MAPQNTIDINADMTTPSAEYSGTTAPHASPAQPAPAAAPRGIPAGARIGLLVLALLVLAAIGYRLLNRASDEHQLATSTSANAVSTVRVMTPTIATGGSEIALPGNTVAFEDTPIFARTSGYLKQWFVDIGQHVAKGQLIAVIETPEVDQQLQVAQANLKSADADLSLARTTSDRYQNLLKSDSVSKQETDVAVSGAAAKQAAVDAAQANVRRLQQLQSFERVYAPFAGVVTLRNTDVGALIDAGSASSPKELFRVASIESLRVYVPVPEVYAPSITNGDTATLTLDEYPGQQFTGTIARNSSTIDPASRTLNVEVDINNADHKLLPGAYVFVHFKIPQQARLLSVPSNTLLFRAEGLRVGIVRNGRVHLQPVTIGKDSGKAVEISAGLSAGDQVILDPSDSLTEGQQVKTATNTSGAAQ